MPAPKKFMTLERFINEQESMYPGATGEFSGLLHDLSLAAKLVWREVSKAGLVNILGTTDQTNSSGDIVKKLDVFADETIFHCKGGGTKNINFAEILVYHVYSSIVVYCNSGRERKQGWPVVV